MGSSFLTVKVLAVVLHYSFARCYHWVKDTWNLSVLFLTMACCCLVAMLCGALCDPHALWPTGPLCPGDFPGKDTGVGSHFLLQGIFPTRDQTCCLLHWQVGSLLSELPQLP